MSKSAWKDKYDRVIRHKKRIIYNYDNYSDNDEYLKDDLINFCIHCFHLYEWIGKEIAEDYVKKNEYLVLCGGIANLSKHFIVERYKNDLYRKDAPIRIANILTASTSTGFSGDIIDSNIVEDLALNSNEKIMVSIDSKKYELFDILNSSILAWDRFLLEQGMDNSK